MERLINASPCRTGPAAVWRFRGSQHPVKSKRILKFADYAAFSTCAIRVFPLEGNIDKGQPLDKFTLSHEVILCLS